MIPCAVIGIGQTKYAAKRSDVSMPGLVREAAIRALEDAGLDWSDIDAVVMGKAPDMFEGVPQPELFMAGALGAVGKPMIRVHTAGSVGGSTALVATSLITGGVHRPVLTVAWEKQSESNAMWALSQRFPFQPPVAAGAGGYFAPIPLTLIPSPAGLFAKCASGKISLKSGLAVAPSRLWHGRSCGITCKT